MDEKQPIRVCHYHSGIEERCTALCRKLDEREKQFQYQMHAHGEALKVAREELDRRLEAMNEFRAQLTSQAATFAPVKEVDLKIEKLEEKSQLTVRNAEEKFRLVMQPLLDKVALYERNWLKEEGSIAWKNHIVTVLLALAIFIMGHWILKF